MDDAPRPRALAPRKTPRQARSAFLFDAVIEAAVRVLLAEGYAALNTRRVAEVAGVSVGSLYQYFPHREALVAEVIRRRAEGMTRCVAEACDRADGPLEAAVAGVARAFVAEKRRTLPLARALREPLAALEGRRAIQASAAIAEAAMARMLERITGAGLDAAMRRRLALAMAAVEGLVSRAAEEDPDALAEPAFEAVLAGMLLAALDPRPAEGSHAAAAPP